MVDQPTTAPAEEGPDFYEQAAATIDFGKGLVQILARRKPREGWTAAQLTGRETLKADLPGIWAQAQAQATMALVEAVQELTDVIAGEGK